MKSIFRYPGGKSKTNIRQRIFYVAPLSYDEYREPFVGGGGIFFAVDTRKKRWINDINCDLISVYKALRDRPQDFINSCRNIDPMRPGEPEVFPKEKSKGKKYNKRLKEKFDYFSENIECDQALRYFYVNRTVWAGRVNYELSSRMYFSNPEGWNITKTRKLEQAAKTMRDVSVTCGNYEELLDAPGSNVWIYCDPPYMRDTELEKSSKLYKYSFTENDHVKFAEKIKECKHKVCISYDDHPLIRELFSDSDFHIVEEKWLYCGSSKSKKDTGHELLITNYPATVSCDIFAECET